MKSFMESSSQSGYPIHSALLAAALITEASPFANYRATIIYAIKQDCEFPSENLITEVLPSRFPELDARSHIKRLLDLQIFAKGVDPDYLMIHPMLLPVLETMSASLPVQDNIQDPAEKYYRGLINKLARVNNNIGAQYLLLLLKDEAVSFYEILETLGRTNTKELNARWAKHGFVEVIERPVEGTSSPIKEVRLTKIGRQCARRLITEAITVFTSKN